jgi:hypothetical protein
MSSGRWTVAEEYKRLDEERRREGIECATGWIGCSRPEFSQGHDRTESIGYGYGGRHGARSEGKEIDSSSIEGNQSPLSHPVRMNQKDVHQKERNIYIYRQDPTTRATQHHSHPAKQQFCRPNDLQWMSNNLLAH